MRINMAHPAVLSCGRPYEKAFVIRPYLEIIVMQPRPVHIEIGAQHARTLGIGGREHINTLPSLKKRPAQHQFGPGGPAFQFKLYHLVSTDLVCAYGCTVF
ncbi:MAG: hypothetical protein ACOYJC_02960 [Christensenellales bacterium]